jgi:hypothetical protein
MNEEGYARRLKKIAKRCELARGFSSMPYYVDPDVSWLLDQLRDRDRQLAEAREVLAPLLEKPWRDIWTYSDPDATCIFCERSADLSRPHEDDCPVLRKDAILGRQASDDPRDG